MNERVDIIKKRARFFFEHKISVHIDTLTNRWYNGLILEFHPEFIIILDRKVGETPVYFQEIIILDKNKSQDGEEEKDAGKL